MNPYVKLIRPKHWVKNILILIPLLFSGEYDDITKWGAGLLGICAWSLMASAGYVLNDLSDISSDRLHPVKKKRPLASGNAKVKTSWKIAIAFIIMSLLLMFGYDYIYNHHLLKPGELPSKAGIIISIYAIVNWAYSNYFKKQRFLDIAILTSFYLLRIYLGSTITNTYLTGWFLATITLVFISMSFNKRKMECDVMKAGKISGRGYTLEDKGYLQILSIVFGFGSIIFLNLYTILEIDVKNEFSIAGLNLLCTYLLTVYLDDRKSLKNDDPVDKLMNNKSLIVGGLALLAYFIYYIFYHKIH